MTSRAYVLEHLADVLVPEGLTDNDVAILLWLGELGPCSATTIGTARWAHPGGRRSARWNRPAGRALHRLVDLNLARNFRGLGGNSRWVLTEPGQLIRDAIVADTVRKRPEVPGGPVRWAAAPIPRVPEPRPAPSGSSFPSDDDVTRIIRHHGG